MEQHLQDPERLDLPSASDEAGWNCPGKWNLQKELSEAEIKAIETQPDELRDSGTRLHKARELGVPMDLTEDELELYNAGLKYEERLIQEWLALYDLVDCEEGPRELRLWLNDENTMAPIASGKLDTHYLSGTHACIIDWKAGFTQNLTEATRHSQLRLQAVLLWREHDGLTNIRVAFAKPRLNPNKQDYADYHQSDLERAHTHVLYWLWYTKQPDAPRIPGPHCNFCVCKGICKEAACYALLPSVIAQRALPSSTDISAMVGALKPVDLVKLWESKSTIEKILAEVVKRLKAMTVEDRAALGLELGKGRAMNPIVKTRECFAFLKNIQNWNEDDLWAAMTFSNGALAELAVKDKNLSKDAAAKWVRVALAEFIEAKTAEPPLKRIQ